MKIKKNFICRKIGEETVVVPVGDNEMKGVIKLNGVAGDIWKFAEENNDNEAIAEKLTEIYDVTKEKALNDVIEFEKKLLESGICE